MFFSIHRLLKLSPHGRLHHPPFAAGRLPPGPKIYETGLETGHATFELRAPTWEEFSRAKIMDTVFVAAQAHQPRTGGKPGGLAA